MNNTFRIIGFLDIGQGAFKDDLMSYKCLYFNKNYQKQFDEILKKIFAIYKYSNIRFIYKFFNHGINNFIFCCCKKVFPNKST